MTYRMVTPPAVTAVTLADAKIALRIDGNDLDVIVTAWIGSVTAFAEHATGRAMIHQTWRVTHDRFPTAIKIPRAPIASVTTLKYVDPLGVEYLLDAADYEIDAESEPGWIVPAVNKTWPETFDKINAVKVEVVCGYGAAATAVPAGLRLYILAKLVEQFDGAAEIATTPIESSYVDRMLDPYTLAEFG
jgi:uncharacterized phiE125 gp8 family phage protein